MPEQIVVEVLGEIEIVCAFTAAKAQRAIEKREKRSNLYIMCRFFALDFFFFGKFNWVNKRKLRILSFLVVLSKVGIGPESTLFQQRNTAQ